MSSPLIEKFESIENEQRAHRRSPLGDTSIRQEAISWRKAPRKDEQWVKDNIEQIYHHYYPNKRLRVLVKPLSHNLISNFTSLKAPLLETFKALHEFVYCQNLPLNIIFHEEVGMMKIEFFFMVDLLKFDDQLQRLSAGLAKVLAKIASDKTPVRLLDKNFFDENGGYRQYGLNVRLPIDIPSMNSLEEQELRPKKKTTSVGAELWL